MRKIILSFFSIILIQVSYSQQLLDFKVKKVDAIVIKYKQSKKFIKRVISNSEGNCVNYYLLFDRPSDYDSSLPSYVILSTCSPENNKETIEIVDKQWLKNKLVLDEKKLQEIGIKKVSTNKNFLENKFYLCEYTKKEKIRLYKLWVYTYRLEIWE